MKILTVLTVTLTMMSSMAFAGLENYEFRNVYCKYEIANGPTEEKKFYVPFTSTSTSRGPELYNMAKLSSCAGFFTEARERLNPNGNLEFTLSVNDKSITVNNHTR